jgi:protein-disulfide isomerase
MTTQQRRLPASPARQQRQLLIIGAIVVVAVVAVIAAIALSGTLSSSEIDYSAIPQSRTEDGAYVLGSPDAPVTIIEFADFACPHCQDYHGTVQQFIKDYVQTGKAKFEYRSFPTAGGALTDFASRVLECADNESPGAFWKGYKLFYDLAMTARFTDDIGRVAAREFGLNYADVLDCTNTAQQVRTDVNFGTSMGVSGTPAVMMRVNDGDAQWITYNGVTYSRGSVPGNVLAAVVDSYQ